MSQDKPKIAQKAPYVMDMESGTYYWCACGASAKQPFCDGSHKGTSIVPLEHKLEEAKKVAWCGCKHSEKGCLCDGSHTKL